MSATLLEGKRLADSALAALAPRIAALKQRRGRELRLAVVASDAAEARRYLKQTIKTCEGAGVDLQIVSWPERAGPAEAARALAALGQDARIDGVLVDLPLPSGLSEQAVFEAIPFDKDAEGVHPLHYGRLFAAKSFAELRARGLPAPCTALAIAELLRETRFPLTGKRAVVVGRSTIVGRPVAHLLSTLDLTVTLCHSKSRDIEEIVGKADVLVACLGKPGSIKGSWIKPGAVVLDAGTNVVAGKLRGDVDPAAAERAAYLTPALGGLGPVTAAMLLANLVGLAEKR